MVMWRVVWSMLLVATVVDSLRYRPHSSILRDDGGDDQFVDQYFEQKLDHFHPDDKRTFQQRYYVNDLYFTNPNGPVFMYLSGEAPLYGPPRRNSHIDLLAQRHKALVIALEHRYYGTSVPFDQLTTKHLKYLNTRQKETLKEYRIATLGDQTSTEALLDTAAFIMFYQAKMDEYKSTLTAQQIKMLRLRNGGHNHWITFGGSYAGALAAWMRLKFPDLISGAITSSAVVNTATEFYNFDSAIAQTVGVQCATVMRQAMDDVDLFLANNADDNAYIKRMFNASILEDGDFRYMLSDATSMAVQYGYKEKICDPLLGAMGRGRMALLNSLSQYMQEFFYPTLEQTGAEEYSVAYLRDETVDEDKCGRQWWFQKCSEIGFFQVAPPKFSTRSPHVNTEYHRQLCMDLFGPEQIWPDTQAVNNYYGGADFAATRVFFANGGEDPWRSASVLRSKSPANTPAEIAACQGCGHCVDMKEPRQNDPVKLAEVREDIDRFLTAWLET